MSVIKIPQIVDLGEYGAVARNRTFRRNGMMGIYKFSGITPNKNVGLYIREYRPTAKKAILDIGGDTVEVDLTTKTFLINSGYAKLNPLFGNKDNQEKLINIIESTISITFYKSAFELADDFSFDPIEPPDLSIPDEEFEKYSEMGCF